MSDKTCACCGMTKDISEFYETRGTCKECRRKQRNASVARSKARMWPNLYERPTNNPWERLGQRLDWSNL